MLLRNFPANVQSGIVFHFENSIYIDVTNALQALVYKQRSEDRRLAADMLYTLRSIFCLARAELLGLFWLVKRVKSPSDLF